MAAAPDLLGMGGLLLGVAVLGRLAAAAGIPPLIAPLAAGLLATGAGPLPDRLRPPSDVTDAGATLALVLLLFSLGLDQTRADRVAAVRSSGAVGLVDAALNLVPGFAAGLLLGWGVREAVLLGGATWASSPGGARAMIAMHGRVGNRETPAVLALLTLENVGLCAFLPLAAALVTPGGTASVAASVLATGAAVAAAAWFARERGPAVRRSVFGHPDDVIVPVLAVALLAAGLADAVRVPAPAAALLAGAVLAGRITTSEPARSALGLLRQLAVAGAFLFLGLSVEVDGPGIVAAGVLLAVVTSATKLVTGWWSTRCLGVAARFRAGAALIVRGEFSVALALIGREAGLAADLPALAAVYVGVTIVGGAALARAPGIRGARLMAARPAAG